MSLFRRSTPPVGQPAAIAEFWTWWKSVRDEVAAGISGEPVHVDEINRRVATIASDLQWELTPGIDSQHALVVTAAGDSELRATAARWLAGAPDADEVWSYRSARIADPKVFSATLELGDTNLELAGMTFAYEVHKDHHRVDVRAHHPSFAEIPDGVRAQVTFLCLDWLLGETEVETWIGAVEWSDTALADAGPPELLAAAVAEVAAGGDSWALLRGSKDGKPLMAMVNLPLRPARWPRFDTHVAVVLPYRAYNDGEFPIEGSLAALREIEDSIQDVLGSDGALVAHQSGSRRRTLHYYVDGETDLSRRLAEASRQWPEGKAVALSVVDPTMRQVSHLV
jgi:hypothetical protein